MGLFFFHYVTSQSSPPVLSHALLTQLRERRLRALGGCSLSLRLSGPTDRQTSMEKAAFDINEDSSSLGS